MKKIRNILIICVLTMFMIPLYSKAQTINLKSSNKNDMVKPGDKIDIIISKEGIEDNYQIDGVLSYDENILELQTQQDGKKYVVLDENVNFVQMNSKNNFSVMSDNSNNEDIIKFTFLVKKNTKFDSTQVKIDNMNVINYNLDFIISNSSQEITLKRKNFSYGIIIILIIFNMVFPVIIDNLIQEDYLNKLGKNDFSLQCICLLLGVVQIIFTLGNISLTAISREGKDAIFMKYIPVPIFKQFLWKSIPQIFCNLLLIIGITFVVAINMPKISIIYYIVSIALAMILNIINSFLMLIVDLKKPNLDWITETSVLKDNRNKLYQYVLTILIVLTLLYFTKIFNNIDIKLSVSIISIIFIVTLIIILLYIKRNINKLFKNIY